LKLTHHKNSKTGRERKIAEEDRKRDRVWI